MALFKKNAEVETLTERIGVLEESTNILREECEGYKRTISAFPGVKAQYDADLKKVKAEHEGKMTSLKADYENKLSQAAAEKKAIQVSVNKRVNAEIASMGIPLSATPMEDNIAAGATVSAQEALQTLNTLTGTAAREYYQKHKALLDKAVQQ
jgi:hypothetical protein